MRVLALIVGVASAVSFGFAVWEHDLSLAAANFNTLVWTTLYAFKD